MRGVLAEGADVREGDLLASWFSGALYFGEVRIVGAFLLCGELRGGVWHVNRSVSEVASRLVAC